jgi:hypothetical protein
MRTWMIWRDIAVGLGIAAIAILMTLCAIGAGMAQPRVVLHSPGVVQPLHGDPAATVSGPSGP